MAHRLTRAFAGGVLAVSLALTGCSGGQSGSAEGSQDFPAVEGKMGEQPTISAGKGNAPSELKTRVLTKGDGPEVKETDTVSVDYVGQTWEGSIFDHSFGGGAASAPRVFSLQQVVSGWTKGLAGKHVGDRVEIVIPPSMGYGDQEQRDQSGKVTIPKNSTLVFVVDIHGAIDTTNTKALGDATPNDEAQIPEWLHVEGKLGEKPTITIDEGAPEPTEQQVIILAEGKGEAIEADDYVAAHMTVRPFDKEAGDVQSTYDMGPMQVTSGPVGSAMMYTGMKIGSRAILLTPAGEATNGQKVPGAVYVIDYGAKMNATRSAGK